jgi:hypothetical protein
MNMEFWMELSDRNNLEYLGIYGSMILKFVLEKYGVKVWTG